TAGQAASPDKAAKHLLQDSPLDSANPLTRFLCDRPMCHHERFPQTTFDADQAGWPKTQPTVSRVRTRSRVRSYRPTRGELARPDIAIDRAHTNHHHPNGR